MMVFNSVSSEKSKCVRCNAATRKYKIYRQSNIEIKIPVCDEHYKTIDVQSEANIAIKAIRANIQLTANEEATEA